VIEYTGQVAEVSRFANLHDTIQDVPIVKAVVAHDHPGTGQVIIHSINQALYFWDQLDEILLNPNQICAHGDIVDDVPKHLGGSKHAITIPEEDMTIPLKLRG
jgi:hypothetical protein